MRSLDEANLDTPVCSRVELELLKVQDEQQYVYRPIMQSQKNLQSVEYYVHTDADRPRLGGGEGLRKLETRHFLRVSIFSCVQKT
jgi:hypothetical protein